MPRRIFLFSTLILPFTACKKEDCTKLIQTDSYWSAGVYFDGTKTEVPCDFPEPEPIGESQ